MHVDDLIITSDRKEEISHVIWFLDKQFSIKDLEELNYFLGKEVNRVSSTEMHLSQRKYIKELHIKTRMHNAKQLPMTSNLHISKYKGESITNEKECRNVVGALQYATITRPEIFFSVNKVCQFMHQPLSEHWKAIKHILRYLNGTQSYGLLLRANKSLEITGFSDAYWASNPDDKRSTAGYCIYLEDNPVSWCSKKQATVSRSSTESE